MKIAIEISPDNGLLVTGQFNPIILRVLAPLAAGALALPWLTQLAHAMGWM